MAQPKGCAVLINLCKPSRNMVIYCATVAANNPPHTPTHTGTMRESYICVWQHMLVCITS